MKSKKIDYKKYNESETYKEYFINFIAGLMGGFTVLYFGFIVPHLLAENWMPFIIGVIIYIVIGIVSFILGWLLIKKIFVKK